MATSAHAMPKNGRLSPRSPAIAEKAKELLAKSAEERSGIMLSAKNDRIRAEGDVQLLANRLAHLRVGLFFQVLACN